MTEDSHGYFLNVGRELLRSRSYVEAKIELGKFVYLELIRRVGFARRNDAEAHAELLIDHILASAPTPIAIDPTPSGSSASTGSPFALLPTVTTEK